MRHTLGYGNKCDICHVFLGIFTYHEGDRVEVLQGEKELVWRHGSIERHYLEFDSCGNIIQVYERLFPQLVCEDCHTKYMKGVRSVRTKSVQKLRQTTTA